MRKLVLFATMLATVLAVSIPAVAQMGNTGNFTNQQGFVSDNPTSVEVVGTEDGALSGENACRDQIVDTLVSELGMTPEEIVEILEYLEAEYPEEFNAWVEGFCS